MRSKNRTKKQTRRIRRIRSIRSIRSIRNTRRTRSIRNTRSIRGGSNDECSYRPGSINWPGNYGCKEGTSEMLLSLEPETKIDRFGHDFGYYFGEPGNSFNSRSLASMRPNNKCKTTYNYKINKKELVYNLYTVLKRFDVMTCTAEEAFGHKGGATQYRLFEGSIKDAVTPKQNQSNKNVPNVADLLKLGYIARAPVTVVPAFKNL